MKKNMEKYPWISFEINLKNMPFNFWLMLGQCVSKCSHIKQIPLLPEIREKLHSIYLAKGVAATTAIEGNTLGENKVLEIIEGKTISEPSKQYQEQEVKNIIAACNYLATIINRDEDTSLSKRLLCDLNSRVLAGNIPIAEGAVPGKIRTHSVVVGDAYRAPDAQDVPGLVDEFCKWINQLDREVRDSIDKFSFAIIKAIATHLYIAWIHPFGDGNGRTARLVEFMILLKSGIPSSAAHLLSNHYNSTRVMYYRNLNLARKHSPSIFCKYAVEGFLDGLEETVIKTIIEQVQFISWQHYVYEKFREMPSSSSSKRQRDVIIEISKQCYETKRAFSIDEIKNMTALIYFKSGKTQKAFTRDFNTILKNDFLEKTHSGFIPKFEPILDRLPFSN